MPCTSPACRTYLKGLPFPNIRRYVLASFAVADDLVSYRVDISHGMEKTRADGGREQREQQQKILDRVRASIQGHIEDRSMTLPIIDGWIRRPSST